MDLQSASHGWRFRAACQNESTDLFFPGRGANTRPVKRLCQGCPVQHDCLEWALHHELFGIWGGTTPDQRAAIRRARSIDLRRPEIDPLVTTIPSKRSCK